MSKYRVFGDVKSDAYQSAPMSTENESTPPGTVPDCPAPGPGWRWSGPNGLPPRWLPPAAPQPEQQPDWTNLTPTEWARRAWQAWFENGGNLLDDVILPLARRVEGAEENERQAREGWHTAEVALDAWMEKLRNEQGLRLIALVERDELRAQLAAAQAEAEQNKTQIVTKTLASARERLLAIMEATEDGPYRRGLSSARSELGLMIDEFELKRPASI